jgi:serine/threonine protein kinase
MTPERLQQIETIYNDALPLHAGARVSFLDRVCGDDGELRREIESLLALEHKAEGYMETSAFQQAALAIAQEGADVFQGRMLGRYQLLSLVGQGGMGQVYCAVDSQLNRLVAVKVLPSYMATDSERVQRFELEARATAALNHPNICTLHDVGYQEGMHYLVFEYLTGEPLSLRISQGAIPLAEALRYALQIAEALEFAHEQGIIHLDLKPSNVMLTRTGVKLLDFGIAELRYPDSAEPGRGAKRHGTLGYMAPEQWEGRETDARTDIFAFGTVLYEMITGHPAFPRAARQIVPPPPLSTVPSDLNALVMRCLALDPSERWQSVSAVCSALNLKNDTVGLEAEIKRPGL